MYKIVLLALATCVSSKEPEPASSDIKIVKYFNSDVFKSFQKHWQPHRRSFENAILLALKDSYGYRGMNVYVRRSGDSLRISNGLYITDNVVDLMLLDMTLTSLPHLNMPELAFALASNVLRLEAGLSKMVVETPYMLFRNQSNVLYSSTQDPYKNSPFTYHQVDIVGQLAIIAEDCVLVGYTLARLSGQSVNLGHDTFRVQDCKFSVEISSNRSGRPVIAPYFSKDQGKRLEMLLTKPIREELIPKLQAAVFTYINTSLIFGEYFFEFRKHQESLFKEALKNVTIFVRNINNLTIGLEKESIELDPWEVSRNFTCQSGYCWDHILLHKVTLHGLDTLYSAQSGGPFKIQLPSLIEALRFNSIMVRGSLVTENNTYKGEHDFVVEIKDTTVNFEIDFIKFAPIFTVFNWRKMSLSVMETEYKLKDRKAASAFVSGYIHNRLPEILEEHLYNVYLKFRNITDIKLNVNVNCNNG